MYQSRIPDSEFKTRIARLQEGMRSRGLDLLLVHSNEADLANVRYLSDYWPIFESAGVLVPAQGGPVLLIGPESEAYARDRSRIADVRKLVVYRESAEPDYPGVAVATFKQVIQELGYLDAKRVGLAGLCILPVPIYRELVEALPKAEMLKADDLLTGMRMIKSPVEVEMLSEAFRISDLAVNRVLETIRPGMTELQVVGVAQQVIYDNGAEYEGMPQYVLAGDHSRHAISRPTRRVLAKGDLVQLNISARVEGYSSGVGRPVCLGRMSTRVRNLVEFGLEAHRRTIALLRPGVPARTVVEDYYAFARERGHAKNVLYGPCHGLGMIEVEPPWMEQTSAYRLQENMTFQVDTFLYDVDFGLRWEGGVCIGKDGPREFSRSPLGVIELS